MSHEHEHDGWSHARDHRCNHGHSYGCCSQCGGHAHVSASNETLASALDNFILNFYGTVSKTVIDGKVVWTLPCNLDAGLPNNPRLPGESTACYFLRLFQAGLLGLTGPQGATGSNGVNGANPWTLTSQGFTQPAVGGNLVLLVENASLIPVDSVVFLESSGWYEVVSRNTVAQLIYLQLHTTAVVAGTWVNAGKRVQVTGPEGAAGPRGYTGATGASGAAGATGSTGADGADGYAYTSASYTQPAVGSTVIVSVGTTAPFAINQDVFVEGGGYYLVSGLGVGTMTLSNRGDPVNAGVGAVIAANSLVTAGGREGPAYVMQHSAIPFAANIPLDFSDGIEFHTIAVTGALTFDASVNLAAARFKRIRLQADGGGPHNLAFPAGWIFVHAAAPANIAANKDAVLDLTSYGTTDANVIAFYTVEP